MSIHGPTSYSAPSASAPVLARRAIRSGGAVAGAGARQPRALRRRLTDAAQSVVSIFRPEPSEMVLGDTLSRDEIAAGLVRVEDLIEEAMSTAHDPQEAEALALGLSLVGEMGRRLRLCRAQSSASALPATGYQE